MSLITRCPACGTMFKVVPDQLRISQGWVRCGHCSEVFDASVHMQPDASAAGPAQATQFVPPQPTTPPVAPVELDIEPFDPFESVAPIEPEPEPELESEPQTDLAPVHAEQGLPTPATSKPTESIAQEAAAPDLHDVSFVRQARRKAFWARPLVRGLLLVMALVLAMLLALQYALQERDRLAAAEPALRPMLKALCEPLACTVGPPRQIEAIVIDSSTFTKLRGDAYRLAFTLKNQANTEVALPAIELTLTDTQDQALMRRILQPSDMGAKSAVIESNSEWSTSFAIAVAANGGGRVAGYRVLAFYP